MIDLGTFTTKDMQWKDATSGEETQSSPLADSKK